MEREPDCDIESRVQSNRGCKPPLQLSTQALDRQVAMAMGVARRLRPPMKVFANELRIELGWYTLSSRAVYAWERGEARVPAAALIAAARITNHNVNELMVKARTLEHLGLRPGD